MPVSDRVWRRGVMWAVGYALAAFVLPVRSLQIALRLDSLREAPPGRTGSWRLVWQPSLFASPDFLRVAPRSDASAGCGGGRGWQNRHLRLCPMQSGPTWTSSHRTRLTPSGVRSGYVFR